MVIHTKSNIGQRITAVSAALFVLLAVSAGAMRTPAASAQSPYQYGYPYNSMYGTSYGASYPYSSMYGTSYGVSNPYSSTYGSSYPSMTSTSYTPSYATATVSAPGPYALSGAYCTLADGGGQVWVPTGASATDLGC